MDIDTYSVSQFNLAPARTFVWVRTPDGREPAKKAGSSFVENPERSASGLRGTGPNQLRFFPRNIVIAGTQKRARWIRYPLTGEQCDGVFLCDLQSWLHNLSGDSCVQS